MKKIFSILFLLGITYGTGMSQTNSIDSLKAILNVTTKPIERFEILDKLVLTMNNWQGTSIDSVYSFEMLRLAQELKNDSLLTISYNWLGSYFYLNKGDNSTGLEYYAKALPLAQKENDKRRISSLYFDIALVYFDLQDYESAVENTRLGGQNLPDKSHPLYDFMLIQYQGNMAQYFVLVNQPDSALYYAEAIGETKKDLTGIPTYALIEMAVKGYAYAQLNDFKKADESFNKALTLSINIEVSNVTLFFYNSYIPFLLSNNRLDDALSQARPLFKLGAYNNNLKLAGASFLRRIYDAMNQIDSAYYYSLQEAVISSEIFSQQNVNRIQALAFNEQLRKVEEKAKDEANQNRLRRNAFLGSTFTLIVIAIFLLRNNRQKSKSKKKIESAYDLLKSTQSQLIQSEKMASLGELTAGIAHEIQNPLNFVNNFSEINTELINEIQDERHKIKDERDEGLENDLLKDIGDNQEKINHHGKRASDIVKSMLEHSRQGDGKKEPTDINKLADEYLRLAYHGLRAKDKSFNADFELDLDESLPLVNVVPQDIGRVLLNLINNAFFVVRDVDKPLVTVKTEASPLEKGEERGVKITVTDNGPGIPDDIKDKIFQPFFTTKPTGQGTGLGLSMSYDIITKGHGGTLTVASNEGNGTIFKVSLPVEAPNQ